MAARLAVTQCVVMRWLQPLAGAAVLGALLWKLGAGPFVAGLQSINAPALVAAAVITLFTTVCNVWRWRLVARGLGLEITFTEGIGAYYRSQFLNSVLPGGVLGDVHRGMVQGRSAGDLGLGLRAVVWERVAGQGVQLILALVILTLLPSPVQQFTAVLAAVLVVVLAAGLAILQFRSVAGQQWWARTLRAAATDVQRGLLSRAAVPGIGLASTGAVAGYVALFLIAAHTVGTTASTAQLLPLAMLVLLAMSIPANLAGWGPREGAAAWVFAAAGLGAAQGVGAAVVYGVLSLVATLPGAVLLIVGWFRQRTPRIRKVHHG